MIYKYIKYLCKNKNSLIKKYIIKNNKQNNFLITVISLISVLITKILETI